MMGVIVSEPARVPGDASDAFGADGGAFDRPDVDLAERHEVRVPKAADVIASKLRRRIVMGELEEGAQLPSELTLMTELGVSRPTLRQALRILENEQLVHIQRGRTGGTRVSRPASSTASRFLGYLLMYRGATLEDVHTARSLLEPSAAAEITGHCAPEDLAGLRALAEQARAAQDPAEVRRLNATFHVRIVELTGNRPLSEFAHLLADVLEKSATRSGGRARGVDSPDLIEDHVRLIELIEVGAVREANRHWRAHLQSLRVLRQRVTETAAADAELDVDL
jgi:DNA-binding FadR family transcriptional regulator